MTPTRHQWLKLDTRVVDGFDAALGARGRRIDTGTAALVRGLAAHVGWTGALGALGSAVRHPAWDLVAGNVQRKRIRLPAVFGNPVVAGVYGWFKAVQAALLRQRLLAEITPDTAALIYNGSLFPESVLALVAAQQTLPRAYVEQGFFPGTLQIDPVGLNAANSVPRDPAFYRAARDFTARGLPKVIAARPAKRRGDGPVVLKPGYVFVAFQVPSDMQVTLHSPWIRDMAQFLTAIRTAADRLTDDTFVIKEHPSFPISVRNLYPPHPRVIFANDNITRDLIDAARAVVTLNSTVGIEALALERPVIVLADACYDIEGLVQRAHDDDSLATALANRDWRPDDALRRQVLGFLWQHYLTHGSYQTPPPDLADRLDAASTPAWRAHDGAAPPPEV